MSTTHDVEYTEVVDRSTYIPGSVNFGICAKSTAFFKGFLCCLLLVARYFNAPVSSAMWFWGKVRLLSEIRKTTQTLEKGFLDHTQPSARDMFIHTSLAKYCTSSLRRRSISFATCDLADGCPSTANGSRDSTSLRPVSSTPRRAYNPRQAVGKKKAECNHISVPTFNLHKILPKCPLRITRGDTMYRASETSCCIDIPRQESVSGGLLLRVSWLKFLYYIRSPPDLTSASSI